MAANYSVLSINLHSGPNYKIIPLKLEHELPFPVENAGIYINHSILIGEILGVDVSEAITVMEMIHLAAMELEELTDRPYNGVPVIPEFAEELEIVFSKVLHELVKGIDIDGRPVGENGKKLQETSYLNADSDNRLYVKSRHIFLFDLLDALQRMIRLIRFSLENNVDIKLE